MTSGQQMMLGGGGPRVELFGGAVIARDSAAPYNCTALVGLVTDGTTSTSATPTQITNTVGPRWFATTPSATYYVRATVTSGTTPNGGSGVGTWLALSSNRTWSNNETSAGTTRTSTLLLEFATDASGGGIFGSVSVDITAQCV